ncbi:MAG: DUF2975 domain-containing protein [Pseudomonadota bacterium]
MVESFTLPRSMRYICLAFQGLVVLIAILSVWLYFQSDTMDQILDVYLSRLSDEAREVLTYSDVKKSLLITLATVAFFAPVLILYGAFGVFQVYRRTDPFHPKAAKSVRFLGLTIVIYAFSRIINHSLTVLLLTYDNPPGTKELSIAINTQDLIVLMIGTLLVIIGHILARAAKIAQENRQFV